MAATKKAAAKKKVAAKKSVGTKSEVDLKEEKQKPKSRAGKHPSKGEDREAPKKVKKQDPFEVAKRRMKGSVPAIVDAMVEKAKQGSCAHAKTLLEMTGARHMFDEGEAQESGEPWAKLVLERLDEAESDADPEKSPEAVAEQ